MKPRFPRATALPLAESLAAALAPACDRIEIAGSLRRQRADVGDIELVYIPRHTTAPDPDNFFGTITVNLADAAIDRLEKDGVLERRTNVNGATMYGPKNKLMRHRATGIPVDLFATTAEAWSNYLVCRTGGAEFNQRVCTLAQAKGWKWNPYGTGFTHLRTGDQQIIHTERELFDFLGIPYLDPAARP